MHGQEGHGPFCSFLPIIFFALQGAPPDASSMSATGEKGKEDDGKKQRSESQTNMPSLVELVGQQLDDSTTQTISKNLSADEDATRAAIAAVVPSIMEGLTRKASTAEGAQQRHDAVMNQHHRRSAFHSVYAFDPYNRHAPSDSGGITADCCFLSQTCPVGAPMRDTVTTVFDRRSHALSAPVNRTRENPTSHRPSEFQFDELGTGRMNVVFLHGLFGSPANWRRIMEDLADRYRFFALQFPIDPHQDRQHKAFHSIGQLTDHVESFFDEMGFDEAVLCGNSLGGQVAVDFCLRDPKRIQALILAGSAGLFERNVTNGKRLRVCRDTIRQQATDVFHDPVHVTDELVDNVYSMLQDRQYRRFLLKVSKATRDRHMYEELADVNVPTLIVWGRNDSITPPFVAEQFRERITHAQLAFIDQCGHSPPIEQPDEFARLLDTFLGSLPAGG